MFKYIIPGLFVAGYLASFTEVGMIGIAILGILAVNWGGWLVLAMLISWSDGY